MVAQKFNPLVGVARERRNLGFHILAVLFSRQIGVVRMRNFLVSKFSKQVVIVEIMLLSNTPDRGLPHFVVELLPGQIDITIYSMPRPLDYFSTPIFKNRRQMSIKVHGRSASDKNPAHLSISPWNNLISVVEKQRNEIKAFRREKMEFWKSNLKGEL